MTQALASSDAVFPVATSGQIAVLNHQSARRRAWSRFWQAPELPCLAEAVVEQEDMAARFLGDVTALDRLGELARRLETVENPPAHVPLVFAQIASMEHRFVDADNHLATAKAAGAPGAATHRLELALDQACGRKLDKVLEARREVADESGRLEELVPLGALLADLGEIEAADHAYLRGLRGYGDVSPFALAWVCFQLGTLWGEVAPDPDAERAALWYRQALSYLPAYARARIHLAEILIETGRFAEAESLLVAIVDTGDPEVHWRLADVCSGAGARREAKGHLRRARVIYAELLGKYPLAYADHGAEFYLAGGNDPARALALARRNLENRPTLRAFELAFDAANAVGDRVAASEIFEVGRKRWGTSKAFRTSPLLKEARESERRHADSP
jgi:tetratricopeptide (TPR) repeat protein